MPHIPCILRQGGRLPAACRLGSLHGVLRDYLLPELHGAMSEKKPVRVSKEALQVIADQFGVLAQPLRLQLLNELQFGERTVTELVHATQAAQANVSKHLNLLATAQMVGRRKEGLNVYYFISDPIVFDLCELMCTKLRADMERKARTLKGGL